MPRESLLDAIHNHAPIIGDGAMGTELQKAGLEPGGCGDEWNLKHRDRVLKIHRAYVDAGSQCLITNTFGSNRFVLSRYELQHKVHETSFAGARIAREAIGDRGWVLGDVGPCGGFLQPLGEVTEGELTDSMREQIGGLLEGGADAIILETITALEEMEIGIRVARELKAPCVIVSMAYDRMKDGSHKTMMGVSPTQTAELANRVGADVVAANCGTGLTPLNFLGIAREYRAATSKPIMLQPNAGQPRLQGTYVVYPVSPAEIAPALIALSRETQIVGACCGSSPAHIAEFARQLRA